MRTYAMGHRGLVGYSKKFCDERLVHHSVVFKSGIIRNLKTSWLRFIF